MVFEPQVDGGLHAADSGGAIGLDRTDWGIRAKIRRRLIACLKRCPHRGVETACAEEAEPCGPMVVVAESPLRYRWAKMCAVAPPPEERAL